jgi:hypothetical protein
MAEPLLRDWTWRTLHEARGKSVIGQAIDSADAGAVFSPDISNPAEMADFFNLLVDEINALNRVVLRFSAVIDVLLAGLTGREDSAES